MLPVSVNAGGSDRSPLSIPPVSLFGGAAAAHHTPLPPSPCYFSSWQRATLRTSLHQQSGSPRPVSLSLRTLLCFMECFCFSGEDSTWLLRLVLLLLLQCCTSHFATVSSSPWQPSGSSEFFLFRRERRNRSCLQGLPSSLRPPPLPIVYKGEESERERISCDGRSKSQSTLTCRVNVCGLWLPDAERILVNTHKCLGCLYLYWRSS